MVAGAMSLGTVSADFVFDMSKALRGIQRAKRELTGLGKSVRNVAKGTGVRKLEGDLNRLNKASQRAKKSMEGVNRSVQNLSSLGLGAAFASQAVIIGKAIDAASDYDETLNVISETFGAEMTPAVEEWAALTGESMGRSQAATLEAAGALNAMLQPMLANVDAANMASKGFARLAVDLGSFFNATDEDALRALQSGLSGQTEPLRRFGIVMTQAALEQFRLNEGIRTSVRDMSEAQKVALRYNFILANTTKAQGDAAKTIGGFANQMKVFRGLAEDAAVSLGQQLKPAFAAVLGVGNDALRLFQQLSPEMQLVATAAASMATAIGTAAAANKVFGGSFSQLAGTLKAISVPLLAVTGAVVGTVAAIGAARQAWRANLGGIRDSVDDFSRFMQTRFQDVSKIFQQVSTAIGRGAVFIGESLRALTSGEGISGVQRALREASSIANNLLAPDLVLRETSELAEEAGTQFMQDFAASFRDGTQVLKSAFSAVLDGLNLEREVRDRVQQAFERVDFGSIQGAAGRGGRGATEAPVVGRRMLGPAVPPEILAANRDAARVLREKNQAVEDFGIMLADSSGGLGELTAQVASAGAAGGPWAAAGAAILGVVTQTEAWTRIQRSSNVTFMRLTDAVNPAVDAFADSLVPILEQTSRALDGFRSALDRAESFVGEELFSRALSLFVNPLTFQAGLVVEAFKELEGAVRGQTGLIRGPGLISERAELESLLQAELEGGNITQSEVDRILAEFDRVISNEVLRENLAEAGLSNTAVNAVASVLGEAAEKQESAAVAISNAASDLTNVPSGFKTALAKFNAIDPGLAPTPSSASPTRPLASSIGIGVSNASLRRTGGDSGFANNHNLTVDTLNVFANDPQEFWGRLKGTEEREGLRRAGAGYTPRIRGLRGR